MAEIENHDLLIRIEERIIGLKKDMDEAKTAAIEARNIVLAVEERVRNSEIRIARLDIIWKVAMSLTATGGVGGGLWKLLS